MSGIQNMIQVVFNPESPSEYEYTISNRRHINHKIGEGSLISDFYDSIGFKLNMLKNIEGKFESNVVFRHADVISRTNQQEIEEGSPNAFNKSLSVFKGLSLTVIYNSQGKISYLQGYDKFKAESDSIFHTYSNKDLKHNLPSETVFTEDYFKTLLEKSILFLPDQLVNLGTTWISTDEMNLLDEKLEFEIENKVVEHKNGILYIETSGRINKELKVSNSSFIHVEGTQSGKIEIETSSGMILNKEANIHLSGNIKIGKLDQFISVEDSVVIKGERK
jgi:hypothetical protein